MKSVLLDECVPWTLRNYLPDHDCRTVGYCGWAGIKNSELLKHAEENGFDVFITSDRNLRYQQNLSGRRMAILELPTNDLRILKSMAGELGRVVGSLVAGEYRCWTA